MNAQSWSEQTVSHAEESLATQILRRAATLDHFGMTVMRAGLVLVLLWIGGLKFARYEADGIVPMVANSPLMSFFYQNGAEYKNYGNKEGQLIPENRAWHEANGTYPFSIGLGLVIMAIGTLIALHPVYPKAAVIGSSLLICMSLTTLSFLITTPEAWVAALGDSAHGFPYLSGMGRLIVKDSIMLGAAVVTLADSARSALRYSE